MEVLLEQGAEVDAVDKRGWTALHWVAATGKLGCIDTLLENVADLKALTRGGRTPRDLAEDNGQNLCLRALEDAEKQDEEAAKEAAELALLRRRATCPITGVLMTDPVLAADGHTYVRASIQGWIAGQQAVNRKPISPATKAKLEHQDLKPDNSLREEVRAKRARLE